MSSQAPTILVSIPLALRSANQSGTRCTTGIIPRTCVLAGALAVLAPWPAAGPALAFLELLLGPPNAALAGCLLLGILDPADQLVGFRDSRSPGADYGYGDRRIVVVPAAAWPVVARGGLDRLTVAAR